VHPNAQIVSDAYAAFGRGDLDAVRNTYMAPDIIFHIPGDTQISGDYSGIDAVFGLFGRLFQETGGTFHLEIHDVLGNDDHVVGITTSKGERNGKPVSYRNVHVAHIRDGKIVEWWEHPEYLGFLAAWS
jgi:ketosteroid isomerase-like protein